MRSDAMTHIPSFIKTGSGIQKLMGEDTGTAWCSHSLLLFFQTTENRLKIMFAAAFAYKTRPRSSMHTKAINQILEAIQKETKLSSEWNLKKKTQHFLLL
jgi:hypothetical protein